MYRLRFESLGQIFEGIENAQFSLPAETLLKAIKSGEFKPEDFCESIVIAEVPAIIWEGRTDKLKSVLSELKSYGIDHALCENIGAVNMCRELGLKVHGGMYLNLLNTSAAEEYEALGLADQTISFEMPFNKMRAFLNGSDKSLSFAMIIYGYLPLMKFRACPAMGPKGCEGCTRDKYLKDRKGESFRILCRNSQYSELLNCVPLYAADKNPPKTDIQTLYFTVESKEDCRRIFEMVQNKAVPEFRRTAGLYNRELL